MFRERRVVGLAETARALHDAGFAEVFFIPMQGRSLGVETVRGFGPMRRTNGCRHNLLQPIGNTPLCAA